MIGNLLLAIGLTIGVGVGGVDNYYDNGITPLEVKVLSGYSSEPVGSAFHLEYNVDYSSQNREPYVSYYSYDGFIREYSVNNSSDYVVFSNPVYSLDLVNNATFAFLNLNTYNSSQGKIRIGLFPFWQILPYVYNSLELYDSYCYISISGTGLDSSLSQIRCSFTKNAGYDLFNANYSFIDDLLGGYCWFNYGVQTSYGGWQDIHPDNKFFDITPCWYGVCVDVPVSVWNDSWVITVNFDFFTPLQYDSDAYSSGYNVGYKTGYATGYDNGQGTGYQNGYIDGQNAGMTMSQTNFMSLFASLVDTPIRMLYSLFNFDLFGTSMLIIILSTLTAIVVIKILKKFI